MRAILLSAGRGIRLKPLTNHIPKPLLKVGEHLLLEYHILGLAKVGIREIVINVAYKQQLIMDTIGDGSRYGVDICYSREPAEGGLETGGGIFKALPLLGDQAFIAISADIKTDYPFERLPNKLEGLAHCVVVDNPDHHPQGDFYLDKGRLSTHQGERYNYAGISVLSPQLFAHCQQGKFQLAPLLYQAIEQQQVTGEHYAGPWVNVGSFEELKRLQHNADTQI